MKKVILFFILVFSVAIAKAQSGYNYYEFGVGGGVSYGKAEADLKKQDYHPAFNLNFVYNYSPYLPVTLELQKGTFSGGGRNIDPYGRVFNNSYLSVNLHADLQFGEIIDYSDNWFLNAVKNFYGGTGIGFIHNNMTDIQRTNQIAANGPIGTPVGFEGKDSGINLIFPLRFGYEFKIFDDYDQPRYSIDLGIQHYFDIGEGIDGYNDSPDKFKNNAIDQYTFITIGFKYNFGTVTAYNKLIRKFQF